jgi:uncharacterized membrane protein YfcA
VRGPETLLMRIVGVLLILLGVVLLFTPWIAYPTREKIAHTDISVKHEKTVEIPTVAGVAAMGAGVLALVLAGRKSQR